MKAPPQRDTLARQLKFKQLLIVDHLARAGSVARAAQSLAMTQPAVTKALQEIESFFGAPLFVRSNRGVLPTDEGRIVLSRAKRMLAELRYLSDELCAQRLGESGHVIVGTLLSASARLLPSAILHLKQAVPGISITVRVGQHGDLFPALIKGEVDLVLGRLPDADSPSQTSAQLPITHHTLYEETMRAVVGRHHPCAWSAEPVSLAELAQLPWILPVPESAARASVARLFARAQLALPRQAIESMSIMTNIALLRDSLMVGLMPRAEAEDFAQQGLLAVVAMKEPCDFGTVGFSLAAERPASAACLRLIDALRRVAAP